MADTKITALTALTAADPANDVIPIVDVSDTSMAASGTTKKISVNNILGASGTATLASATITGDLTVRTNKLAVTSTGVGCGTTTPALPFVVSNAGAQGFEINPNGTLIAGGVDILSYNRSTSVYKGVGFAAESYLFRVGTVSATDAMTLNATGLGIGASPSYKLDVLGVSAATVASGAAFRAIRSSSGDRCLIVPLAAGSGFTIQSQNAAESDFTPIIFSGSTTTFNYRTGIGTVTTGMTLDASGNLLVGTTSSSETSGVGHKINTSATAPWLATVGSVSTNSNVTSSVYSTGAAAYRFYVGFGGTVFATNTTISAISDARLKENVQDIDVGLGAILALKPRKFDWKEGKGKNIKGDRGFIAQEFEQVFPNLVDEWKDEAPEGEAPYKSVRQDLIPVLVKAIQELTARVQTLEAK